jgi:4a-hydroxytetrahydrobiopterin dehydratase
MERRKLDSSEIETNLTALPGWSQESGQIIKTYIFDTYKAGLVFAVAVGHLADRMDHHPDLFIGYQKVKVGLNTHDLGGISTYDFELAKQIESLT